MAFKEIALLLFVAHFAAGFTNCPTSRWSQFEDISQYSDKSIENFGLLGVNREDVTFRLWTRSQTTVYAPIYVGQLKNEDSFRLDQPFKIVIHGWSDCGDSYWYEDFKNAYLTKGDYNVILVDWTKPAGAFYPFSAGYTRDVGKYVGELIVDLNQTLGVPYENIHLIGHSLGSHISGFAGKHVKAHVNSIIGRISGLDPAGPLFLLANSASRLDRSDAIFVDVIHTDGGKFGYSGALGHADFYPNGGSAPQTGCYLFRGVVDVASCSHTRAYWLWLDSINSSGFISKICRSFNDFITGECSGNPEAEMGENIKIGTTGVYYLTTKGEAPFANNGEI